MFCIFSYNTHKAWAAEDPIISKKTTTTDTSSSDKSSSANTSSSVSDENKDQIDLPNVFFDIPSTPRKINYQRILCPTVHPEHARLINEFRKLKTLIISQAYGCQPEEKKVLTSAITGVENFLASKTRKKTIKETVTNKNKTLAPSQVVSLQKYTGKAIKTFFNLLSSVNSNKCLEDSKTKTQILGSAAKIISETTQLASLVAGPYGAPIMLFGSAATGILQGLKDYTNSVKGYDFELPSQRESYREILCAYFSLRQQLDSTINPKKKIKELTILKQALFTRLARVSTECSECKQIAESYIADEKGFNFSNPKWLDLAQQANKKYTNKKDLSSSSQDLLSDEYEQPLGQVTLESINALKWVQDQKKLLEKFSASGYSSTGPAELLQLKISLDRFLFKDQAYQYIDQSLNDTDDMFDNYIDFTSNWTMTYHRSLRPVPHSLVGNKIDDPKTLENLILFFNKKEPLNHVYAYDFFIKHKQYFPEDIVDFDFVANYDQSHDLFELFHFNLKSVHEYCDFFKDIRLSIATKRLCSSKNLNDLTQKDQKILNDISNSESAQEMFSLLTASTRKEKPPKAKNWLESLEEIEKVW